MNKYIWDVGVLLLSIGVTFMATEIWPWAYWPGVGGIYVGLAAIAYHTWSDESFQALAMGTQIAVGVIFMCLIYIWSANIFAKAPILLGAISDPGNYRPGTNVGGINWQAQYSDLRITLTNPIGYDYRDVDLSIYTDKHAQISQITEIPSVSFFPQNTVPFVKLSDDPKGDFPITPQRGMMQSSQIYRVLIDKLPKHSSVQLVLAIVNLNPPKPDGSLPDQLFAPKSPAKWVVAKGTYKAIARERHIDITHDL